MQIPDWIDLEAWAAYTEMRKAKGKRAPFTERAASAIILKLNRLRQQGNPPNEVLWESVMNGWSGVFPIRDRRQMQPVLMSGAQPLAEPSERRPETEAQRIRRLEVAGFRRKS